MIYEKIQRWGYLLPTTGTVPFLNSKLNMYIQ